MTPRALAVSTWGQLASLGILPPLMRMTDEAPTAAVAAAPADEPGCAGYLVHGRNREVVQVSQPIERKCGEIPDLKTSRAQPEPDPREPASQIDDDSPRRVAIDQNGNDGTHYVCHCGNAGHCACGSA